MLATSRRVMIMNYMQTRALVYCTCTGGKACAGHLSLSLPSSQASQARELQQTWNLSDVLSIRIYIVCTSEMESCVNAA